MELKAEAPPKGAKQRPFKRVRNKLPETIPGNGTLQEPVNFGMLQTLLKECTAPWVRENLKHDDLRDFVQLIDGVRETCAKRLFDLESQRSAQLCAACKKPLPHGRFAGEIIIRDTATQELVPLRACSEGCYREVSRIANERRAASMGQMRGSVAL